MRIEEDKNGVKVAADRFDSRMQTLPREDFPTLPEATGTVSATLPRDVLKQMVGKTQFAITGEDTRYFLNGALFILRADSMSLVSTDGHRLALVIVPRDDGQGQGQADDEVRVILPRKTLLELGRLLAGGRRRHPLRARREPPVLRHRRPAADLADDRRAVPGVRAGHSEEQRQARRVRSRSADQRGPARRAALERASRAVKFQIDKGKVEIASSSPEFGEAKEVLMVDYAGAPVTICFNAQYVLDFLGVVETDSVALEFKDEMSQAVMKPIGAEGYDYTYVIMPMRI